MRWIERIAAVVLLVLFLVLLSGRAFHRGLPSGSDLAPYDRALWLRTASAQYVEGDITARQKMLADVVRRLPGLDRRGIEALLGAPSDTPSLKASADDLLYPLGPERDAFFGMDWEFLRISVDADGRFLEYAIVTD